ncbi:MAG: ABC transporter permease [Bryobacteraceae bacterium]|nr:ABC transporter permease [Bryobacteraceae bacterium]
MGFHRLFQRQKFEAEMSEELRFHLDKYTQDLLDQGVPPAEAARRARLEFGGANTVQEECREASGWQTFDELRRQASYAIRLLRKSPGFTSTALATLAICLGANLAIFAVIDAALLRPLPFPEAHRLVTLYNTYPRAGVDRDGASLTNYYERRGQIPAFSSLSIYRPESMLIGEPGATERFESALVSPEFFATVGVAPLMGRTFTEAETTFQTDHVVLLTYAHWQRHYQADPQVVGRPIRVDGLAYKIVGVLPKTFTFLSSAAQLYFPYASVPSARGHLRRHSGNSITMVARLRPGATRAQAQSQIDAHNAVVEADNPQAKMMAEAGFRSVVASLHDDHVAGIRPILLLLQAGVGLLLLIGVVNLVNLLLVRASGRTKELAVRQALGASRRHVATEVLVETTLLTLAGGLLGCAVGAAGIRLLVALGADQLPLAAGMAFDGRVALVALAGAVLVGVALAFPIIWFTLRASLHAESRGGTASAAAQGLRHAFIVSQMTLAFVLLAGAGLLGQSLRNATAVAPGFRPEQVLTGQLSLPWAKYPGSSPQRLQIVERLGRRLVELPGVGAAGIVHNLPFSGKSNMTAVTAKGYRLRPGESVRGHYYYSVSGDYFGAIGLTLKSGRYFTARDGDQRLCVIDEDFAQRYWPSSDPVGQQLFSGSTESTPDQAFTVVGVVSRVKQVGLTDDTPQGAVYFPYRFFPQSDFYLVARARISPESLALAMQRAVRALDADLPVTDLRPMQTRIEDSLLTRRSPTLLAALFSAIALLLTAIGTYGVLSYAVTQRRREIAVRMALGAQPGQIRHQFLRVAFYLLLWGTTLGTIGAWLSGRLMQTLLYQVPSFHGLTLGGVALVMTAATLTACLVPSYRASRVSPSEALAE